MEETVTGTTPPKGKSRRFWTIFGISAGAIVVALVAGGILLYNFMTSAEEVLVLEENEEAAFQRFTKAMEGMEAWENGRNDEKIILEALDNAEAATELYPTAAPYWHLLGYIYSQFRGDTFASTMGEDALEKAIELNPENAASRLLLASLLMDRESYSKALDQLEWAGRKDPKLINSLLAADMCRAYIDDRQAGRGEEFFQEMLKVRPDSSSIRLAAAILLNETGKTDEALKHLAAITADSRSLKDDAELASELDRAWREKKS